MRKTEPNIFYYIEITKQPVDFVETLCRLLLYDFVVKGPADVQYRQALYSVSQKGNHYTFAPNLAKCWPIFEIL